MADIPPTVEEIIWISCSPMPVYIGIYISTLISELQQVIYLAYIAMIYRM